MRLVIILDLIVVDYGKTNRYKMTKIKYLLFLFLFITSVYAGSKKVYFYTTESHISDFKALSVSFEQYLDYFGDYDFQAFHKKEIFEEYLKDENIIVVLSSWHYKQISKKYKLEAKLVALKKQGIIDTKVLVGKKGSSYGGVITTAFSSQYSKELIDDFVENSDLEMLFVPKEIDALMSVGFGMSQFALVSKDSFELLKNANSLLAEQLEVFNESTPTYRMLVASKLKDKYNKELLNIFTTMKTKYEGKKILNILGIDNIVILSKSDLEQLRGTK